jgi:hypothetical protein
MNERIRELMSVAFDTVSGDDKQWCIKYSEKFAELIVKECIKSIRPYDASGHFEETIREHFYGVEG